MDITSYGDLFKTAEAPATRKFVTSMLKLADKYAKIAAVHPEDLARKVMRGEELTPEEQEEHFRNNPELRQGQAEQGGKLDELAATNQQQVNAQGEPAVDASGAPIDATETARNPSVIGGKGGTGLTEAPVETPMQRSKRLGIDADTAATTATTDALNDARGVVKNDGKHPGIATGPDGEGYYNKGTAPQALGDDIHTTQANRRRTLLAQDDPELAAQTKSQTLADSSDAHMSGGRAMFNAQEQLRTGTESEKRQALDVLKQHMSVSQLHKTVNEHAPHLLESEDYLRVRRSGRFNSIGGRLADRARRGWNDRNKEMADRTNAFAPDSPEVLDNAKPVDPASVAAPTPTAKKDYGSEAQGADHNAGFYPEMGKKLAPKSMPSSNPEDGPNSDFYRPTEEVTTPQHTQENSDVYRRLKTRGPVLDQARQATAAGKFPSMRDADLRPSGHEHTQAEAPVKEVRRPLDVEALRGSQGRPVIDMAQGPDGTYSHAGQTENIPAPVNQGQPAPNQLPPAKIAPTVPATVVPATKPANMGNTVVTGPQNTPLVTGK